MQDLIITDPRANLPTGSRVRGTIGAGFAVLLLGRDTIVKVPASYVAASPGADDRIARALGVVTRRAALVAVFACLGLLLSGCQTRFTGAAEVGYQAGLVDGAAVLAGLLATLNLIARMVAGAVYRRRMACFDADHRESVRDAFYAGKSCLARQIEKP